MSKLTERSGGPMLAGTWFVLAIALGTPIAARGEDPKCECPLKAALQPAAIPVLSDLPYVGGLFRFIPPPVDRPATIAEVERLGIDFDFDIGPLLAAPCPIRVMVFECQPDEGRCQAAGCDCQAGTECGAGNCPAAAGGDVSGKACSAKCCELTSTLHVREAEHVAEGDDDNEITWKDIVGLAAHKAALEAALEAQSAILEAKTEVFGSMAELMAEKARLEAKLEAHAEHEELVKRVQELAIENARLKAHVELAGQREEALRHSIQLAVENERLKLRVAALEQAVAEGAAASTAKRTQAGKKAR